MRIPLSTAALAAAMTIAAGTSPAAAQPALQQPAPSQPGGMPTTSGAYLDMASSSDQFEIQSSQVALQRSQDPAVRDFAQRLVEDHTRLSSRLMAAAQGEGMPVPSPALVPQHAALLERVQTAGADFDTVYREVQIAAHEQALNLHRTYAASGDDPVLRNVASRAVPVIELHLQHAHGLAISPAASGPPSPAGPATLRAGERG